MPLPSHADEFSGALGHNFWALQRGKPERVPGTASDVWQLGRCGCDNSVRDLLVECLFLGSIDLRARVLPLQLCERKLISDANRLAFTSCAILDYSVVSGWNRRRAGG